MQNTTYRINVVDALRGFAIFGILMMHSYEQFNLFAHAAPTNGLLAFSDDVFANGIPFLFAGKAYAVFALLFGFSFYIQDNNQLKRGYDFRKRFLWRLLLLFGFGWINAIFFPGEVLILYAMLGVILPLTARLSDKTVLIIAIFLFLMPLQWANIIYALINPEYQAGSPAFLPFYQESINAMREGTFLDMIKNTHNGVLFSLFWWLDSGRIFQTAALFFFGMLIGRKKMFIYNEANLHFWVKALIIAVICYFPLSGLINLIPKHIENKMVLGELKTILSCFSNFALFSIIVSSFIIAYYKSKFGKVLSKFEPMGKMSLTMYVTQSIMGGFVFFHWGLGLGPKLNITYSMLVGVVILIIQMTFAYFWLKSHKHGPLEFLWKKATWVGAKNK